MFSDTKGAAVDQSDFEAAQKVGVCNFHFFFQENVFPTFVFKLVTGEMASESSKLRVQ